MLRNRQRIYLNTANSYRYVIDYDVWKSFTVPAFKIILTLVTGKVFNIFYGVVTADREGFVMGVTPELLDGFTVTILKELTAKCPGIFDLSSFPPPPSTPTTCTRETPSITSPPTGAMTPSAATSAAGTLSRGIGTRS